MGQHLLGVTVFEGSTFPGLYILQVCSPGGGGGVIQFVLFGNLGNKISTLAKFSFFPILFTIFENIVA